ncbi:MAG: 2-amino-4-hydroxy-6-hydroxymethyldihydropteridine diphosphokinase [Arenicella sp.]
MSLAHTNHNNAIYVSIGGNIDPRLHIDNCLQQLRRHFGVIECSRSYESKAVGFEGDNFINLVVKFSSDQDILHVSGILRSIEDKEGRQRNNGKAFDSRTLDLDILLFGEHYGDVQGVELPRPEILEHAHVLLPLSELTGDLQHPELNKTYAEINRQLDFSEQEIWEVHTLSMENQGI